MESIGGKVNVRASMQAQSGYTTRNCDERKENGQKNTGRVDEFMCDISGG